MATCRTKAAGALATASLALSVQIVTGSPAAAVGYVSGTITVCGSLGEQNSDLLVRVEMDDNSPGGAPAHTNQFGDYKVFVPTSGPKPARLKVRCNYFGSYRWRFKSFTYNGDSMTVNF